MASKKKLLNQDTIYEQIIFDFSTFPPKFKTNMIEEFCLAF